METKQDISYGIVPLFRDGDKWQVLVVHQISYRGDDFWIFPKGHAESGESPVEAALRELTEETGVSEVTIDTSAPISISYSFIHEGVRIEKVVEYRIGYCENKSTNISQPHEIKELRWCTFEEARELVTHQNTKDVLSQVEQQLLRSVE
jgi:8-oxo-dGTP pyrophosphatase MutT (NUDIX family)